MSEPTVYSDSFLAMESHCDVVLTNVSEEEAKQIFARVKSEVENLENQLNPYYEGSSIASLSQPEAKKWYNVPADIWTILTLCYDLYQMSNGAFDVTLAPLTELWETTNKPSAEEIAAARQKCGMDKLEFDFDKQTIRFLREGIVFDFGGIQKGFALDKLKTVLEQMGVHHAIVSFGEDAVLALGMHPDGGEWPIGIRNQLNPMEFLHVFPLTDQTLISVGAMEKEGLQEGITKTYTISPESGEALMANKTISVKAKSGVIGAFMAICYLILPENDRAILLDNFKNLELLEVEYLDDDIKTSLTLVNEEKEI